MRMVRNSPELALSAAAAAASMKPRQLASVLAGQTPRGRCAAAVSQAAARVVAAPEHEAGNYWAVTAAIGGQLWALPPSSARSLGVLRSNPGLFAEGCAWWTVRQRHVPASRLRVEARSASRNGSAKDPGCPRLTRVALCADPCPGSAAISLTAFRARWRLERL